MSYTCDCGQKFDLIGALELLSSDRMGKSGMFSSVCLTCGTSIEIRLKNNGFEVGYSYFGGSMHFESMKRVSVKGLKIKPSDPDDLDVAIGDRQWHFGIRHLTSSRFCVFTRAFAAGKRVEELDFNQWNVTLTGVERDHAPLDYSKATVIQGEDFLCLTGLSPALTRAWHYINDGLDLSARLDDVAILLHPFSSEKLEAYPVTNLVNNPKFDGPACIARM